MVDVTTPLCDRAIPELAGWSRGSELGRGYERELDVEACIRVLQEWGFEPAYISDLREGDIWVKEPERFPYHEYATKIMVVDRVYKIDASYYQTETDEMITNVVVNMICTDEDGVSRHISYGSTHGVYIYRGAM